jgi:hypothetical protein
MEKSLESSISSRCDLASSYSELQRLRHLVEQAEKHHAIRLCGRAVTGSLPRRPRRTSAAVVAPSERSLIVVSIINSKGIRVAEVRGTAIFGLGGQKLYHLKGINIYRLSGELVGHLPDTQDKELRLDRSADRLFTLRNRAPREQPA